MTLQQLRYLAAIVAASAAAVTALDVPLNLVADTTFSVIGAAGGVGGAG